MKVIIFYENLSKRYSSIHFHEYMYFDTGIILKNDQQDR